MKNEIIYNGIRLLKTKYKGYYAGEDGNIYSVWKTGAGARSENPFDYNNIRKIKANKTKTCQYLCAKIRYDKKYIHVLIHRIILSTFKPIENENNLEVNHINLNKTDNSLNNLEWTTRKNNILHAVINNRIWNQQETKITNLKTGQTKIFPSTNLALKYIGSKSSINCLKDKKQVIRKGWKVEVNN